MKRREFLSRAAGAALVAGFPTILPALGQQRRPNIVYFMTDDQAWHAMSCAGSKVIKTPNMDRIANEGVMFTNAFVTNSLCQPSRATCLTGKYSHTTGVRTNGGRVPPDRVAFAGRAFTDYLHDAGYHTCFIGKYHMRGKPAYFDIWMGFQSQGRYYDPKLLDFNGKLVQERGHVTDKLGDRAVAYLREHRKDPFCLLLWFKSPHRDWRPAERFKDALKDVDIPLPPTFNDDMAHGYPGRPDVIRRTEMQVEIAKRAPDGGLMPFKEWVKDYYRCLLGVDENIGRVLETLDELKLTENTIVLHTSDNGFFLGEHHFFDKRLMYEPSIRIPMLLRYPALVERGGREIEEMVLNIDIAPTLLDLAGLPVPQDMHGVSWRPLLEGKPVKWREDFLYEYFEGPPAVHKVAPHRGVRTKRWKYIEYFKDNEYELYDLQNDPHEMNNLYGKPEYRAIVEQLRKRLIELRRETHDPDLT